MCSPSSMRSGGSGGCCRLAPIRARPAIGVAPSTGEAVSTQGRGATSRRLACRERLRREGAKTEGSVDPLSARGSLERAQRIAEIAPGAEAAGQRAHPLDTVPPEEQRHPGAGRLAGSGAVEDDLPVTKRGSPNRSAARARLPGRHRDGIVVDHEQDRVAHAVALLPTPSLDRSDGATVAPPGRGRQADGSGAWCEDADLSASCRRAI